MAELVAIAVREKPKTPMTERPSAAVTLEGGVEGDARGKPGPRQVTVLCEESWKAACAEVGEDLAWTLRRANLLVRGIDLVATTGRRLVVGGAVLEVTEECKPCQLMDKQHDGLRAALGPGWRGGVTCRVVQSGRAAVGDRVTFEDEGS